MDKDVTEIGLFTATHFCLFTISPEPCDNRESLNFGGVGVREQDVFMYAPSITYL